MLFVLEQGNVEVLMTIVCALRSEVLFCSSFLDPSPTALCALAPMAKEDPSLAKKKENASQDKEKRKRAHGRVERVIN